tara:strand:- start:21 stop:476 length:456 start_codon:yes stop_codon:yes gene_type:complete
MVIDTYVLLAYATVWTIFYWFLSQYIAELSRQKWTRWVQSADSDEVLLEALDAVVEEIEDRMHEKLQAFQDSFFGSVGQMVKKAKDIDPMNDIRKAAKNNDWTSLLVEYAANKAGLGAVLGGVNASKNHLEAPKEPEINAKPPLPKNILGK